MANTSDANEPFDAAGGYTSPSNREPAAWDSAWLHWTDQEYYNRCRSIMLAAGMGEGDVENMIANIWEAGFMHGDFHGRQEERGSYGSEV